MTSAELAYEIDTPLTFFELLEIASAKRYTGAIVLHFGQGVATRAELPMASVTILLDNGRAKAQA